MSLEKFSPTMPKRSVRKTDLPSVRNRHDCRARLDGFSRGLSFVEVVITVLILSVLTLILTPTVTTRIAQAKVVSATSELKILAAAEERLALDTEFYARVYLLDDVTDRGDGIRNEDPTGLIDGTEDESTTATGTAIHTNVEEIFISISSEDFVATTDFTDTFRADEESFGWHGPYVNWKSDDNDNDWPDDPWGNDYIFFTRVGGLFPLPGYTGAADDSSFVASFEFIANDTGTTESTSAVVFDRPTFLSMGPNSLPGDGNSGAAFGEGDDIYLSFGGS